MRNQAANTKHPPGAICDPPADQPHTRTHNNANEITAITRSPGDLPDSLYGPAGCNVFGSKPGGIVPVRSELCGAMLPRPFMEACSLDACGSSVALSCQDRRWSMLPRTAFGSMPPPPRTGGPCHQPMSSPSRRDSRRIVCVLTLIAGIAMTALPVWAEAGLSEAVQYRSFWVVPPFALEQAYGDKTDVTLFAGIEGKWYDYWASRDIEYTQLVAWEVRNVRCYGVHGRSEIYGATHDGMWFILNAKVGPKAGPKAGCPGWCYVDEAEWREKVRRLGGDPDKLLTFEQGYRASRQSLWMWRICKMGIALAVFFLGWVAVRSRYRKTGSPPKGTVGDEGAFASKVQHGQ